LTVLDYVKIMGVATSNDRQTQHLAEYLCEMSLLYTDLSVYSQATIAAACQLLARLTLHRGHALTVCSRTKKSKVRLSYSAL